MSEPTEDQGRETVKLELQHEIFELGVNDKGTVYLMVGDHDAFIHGRDAIQRVADWIGTRLAEVAPTESEQP